MNSIGSRFQKLAPKTMLLCSIAWCGIAAAAPSPSECHAIADPTGRLLCYDQTTGRTDPYASKVPASEPESSLPSGNGVPAVAPTVPTPTPPVHAGTAVPSEPTGPLTEPASVQPQSTRGLKAPVTAPEEVTPSPIVKLEQTSIGRYRFHLENGEVWEQVEAGRISVHEGDTVKVQHSTFGAWLLREVGDGSRTVRVRRIQ